MKVAIATPLYPPDIAEPAPYVKELATRLAVKHEVTVVAYGHLPEPVEGARVIGIEKRSALPVRLTGYFFALFGAVRGADVLFVENGSSTELPAVLVSLFTRVPLVLHMGDRAAHEWSKQRLVRHLIERIAITHATRVIEDIPQEKPEIIPFKNSDSAAKSAYDASWARHLALVEASLPHD